MSQSRLLLPARSDLRAAGRAGGQARSRRPAPAHLLEMNRAALRVSLLLPLLLPLLLLAALGRAGSNSDSDQEEHGGEEPPHSPGKGEQGSLVRGAPRVVGHSAAAFGVPVHEEPQSLVWDRQCLSTLMRAAPQSEFGVSHSRGALMCRIPSFAGLGVLDEWSAPVQGVLDLGCLMLCGEVSPMPGVLPLFSLGMGGCCISWCTRVRALGAPQDEVPLWRCFPPIASPSCGRCTSQHVPAFVPAPANSRAARLARPLPRGWALALSAALFPH